jgi:hypothetical protein
MCLQPKEEIGNEVHEHVDQFFRIEEGRAKFVLNGTEEHLVGAGGAVVVPAGTYHNVINTSPTKPLKLYTVYTPPQHPDGTVHKTKAEARRRNWTQAQDTIVLGDGAPWIWNPAQDHFFDSRPGVDWYHAKNTCPTRPVCSRAKAPPPLTRDSRLKKHLGLKVTQTKSPPRCSKRPRRARRPWITSAVKLVTFKTTLVAGNTKNSAKMASPSGGVWSRVAANGTQGQGMRWSRPSIECLISIRAAIMSHHFDQAWQAAYKSPPN